MRNDLNRKRTVGYVRRNIILVLAMGMFLSFLLSDSLVYVEAKSAAKRAYKVYINKHLKKYPSLEYGLYDINKDGTKEMIVRYESGVRFAYQIYTYKKGKVKKLHKGEIGGAGNVYRIKGKKKIIISYSNGASDNGYSSYRVKGKKLKKGRVYSCKYNENTGKVQYFCGKKKISEAVYNRFVNRLKQITLHT